MCLSVVVILSSHPFTSKTLSSTTTLLLLLTRLFTTLHLHSSQTETLTLSLSLLNLHAVASYDAADYSSRSIVLMVVFCTTVVVVTV